MIEPLIVGAGPTGLSAALFLAQRDVPTRVVDAAAAPSPYSKAFGVNPRTLALLEPTGVTGRLLAQGRRMTALNVWRRGRRHVRLDLARERHRYPFMLIHSQADTEAALADALAARGIGVERGTTLTTLQQDAGLTFATLNGAAGEEHVEPLHLLGADGASSAVRKALGIDFAGTAYEEPWRLYDIELDTPFDRDDAHAFLLDDGAAFIVRLRGDVWRLLGNVPDLPARIPGTAAGRVEWESDFGISHRRAERMQQGGVALAGDAAHIHSGLGARGMNLGIEDAHVYASLLAHGRVGDYGALRVPFIADAMRRIEALTEIPRGRSRRSRIARALLPWVSPLIPAFAGRARRFILGLDHAVDLTAPSST